MPAATGGSEVGLGAGPGEEAAGPGLEREAGAVSRERGGPVKEKSLNPAGRAAHSGLWARLAVAPSPQRLPLPRSTEHGARSAQEHVGWMGTATCCQGQTQADCQCRPCVNTYT